MLQSGTDAVELPSINRLPPIELASSPSPRSSPREERLRIGREKESETVDHDKHCLATLKALNRGDNNESERTLRLEKVTRFAVETVEERRARLENDIGTKQISLVMETEEERTARLEKMLYSYYKAQVGPGDRGRKKSKK